MNPVIASIAIASQPVLAAGKTAGDYVVRLYSVVDGERSVRGQNSVAEADLGSVTFVRPADGDYVVGAMRTATDFTQVGDEVFSAQFTIATAASVGGPSAVNVPASITVSF